MTDDTDVWEDMRAYNIRLEERAWAAEAEVKRLRDILQDFLHDADNNDRPDEGLRDLARAALAAGEEA